MTKKPLATTPVSRLTESDKFYLQALGVGKVSADIIYRQFDLETLERMEKAGLTQGGIDPIPHFQATEAGLAKVLELGLSSAKSLARKPGRSKVRQR